MINYTLTTDLITDCMALIPQHLELLKESQNDFEILLEDNQILFGINGIFTIFDDYKKEIKFIIISHCLRTIPELQADSPLWQKQFDKCQRVFKNGDVYNNPYNFGLILGRLDQETIMTPKSIAAATLHGQGEFPPSSLEELCESYKYVMSK